MDGYLLNLPCTDYGAVHTLQNRLVEKRRAGDLDRDVVIFVEHPPVYTLGRRGGLEHLMISEDLLQDRGVSVVQTERGGNITWHGPGQLVAYPIVHLEKAGTGVSDFVSFLEGVMVKTLKGLGVWARSDPVNRGVWVEEKKIGSVGLRIKGGVSFHGLALNICPDLTFFSWINPCGLKVSMTTAEMEAGEEVSLTKARQLMALEFQTFFDGNLEEIELEELGHVL
ncbi:MAG: lipoyl(octanoyl) transferase LipB [Desulfobacterales bacterium]|nr:lipoyl(octanoyl) transferase LipB [Desulfobacterales bacterium]